MVCNLVVEVTQICAFFNKRFFKLGIELSDSSKISQGVNPITDFLHIMFGTQAT